MSISQDAYDLAKQQARAIANAQLPGEAEAIVQEVEDGLYLQENRGHLESDLVVPHHTLQLVLGSLHARRHLIV